MASKDKYDKMYGGIGEITDRAFFEEVEGDFSISSEDIFLSRDFPNPVEDIISRREREMHQRGTNPDFVKTKGYGVLRHS